MNKDVRIITEDLLAKYDLVYIMPDDAPRWLINLLPDSDIIKHTRKNLAFLTVAPFDLATNRHSVKIIDKNEMESLLDIYRTYEPSDRLILLDESNVYGGIWNYVKSGVLTSDEVITAFFE